MLTLQQFKINGYQINLKKIDDENCIVSVLEERTGVEQRLEYNAKTMRKLAEVLSNSPFIFNPNNNER